MKYLGATNQDNKEIKTKAIEFMKTGYQRELNYRHDDGSYSAFGKSDSSGLIRVDISTFHSGCLDYYCSVCFIIHNEERL